MPGSGRIFARRGHTVNHDHQKTRAPTVVTARADRRPIWLRTLAFALFVVMLAAIGGFPEEIRRVLATLLARWWDHAVPVLFPALILAQWFAALFPEWPECAPALLSLASFPGVGTLLALDQARRNPDRGRTIRELAWANLVNPLLFPHPRPVLVLDAGLAVAAWVLVGPPRRGAPRPAVLGLRHPVLQAMNWTTIYGASAVLGGLSLSFLPARFAAVFDPWSAGAPTGLFPLVGLGFGGLGYLLAFAPAMRRARVLTGFLVTRLAGGVVSLVLAMLGFGLRV